MLQFFLEPLLIPRDFRKDPSRPIEAHNAYFIWEAVEQSEKVRGVFQGYRVGLKSNSSLFST